MSFVKKGDPAYVDLLDEDKPIANQKYVCMSFVSPENILKKKEHFFFEKFMKAFDFKTSMNKYRDFLFFVSHKYGVDFNKMNADYDDFITSEKAELVKTDIVSEYKTFVEQNEEELEKEFSKDNGFQTNVRGVKVRGSFRTQEEAELRAKLLQESDPHHDIYVGQVGLWMPFDPEAIKTGKVEYLEEELNNLMHNKIENEAKAKDEFEARVKEAKRAAIEENMRKAKETGVKLTQTFDEATGQLVGIKGTNTTEEALKTQFGVESDVVASSSDIRKELFEGDNIRTGRDYNPNVDTDDSKTE